MGWWGCSASGLGSLSAWQFSDSRVPCAIGVNIWGLMILGGNSTHLRTALCLVRGCFIFGGSFEVRHSWVAPSRCPGSRCGSAWPTSASMHLWWPGASLPSTAWWWARPASPGSGTGSCCTWWGPDLDGVNNCTLMDLVGNSLYLGPALIIVRGCMVL